MIAGVAAVRRRGGGLPDPDGPEAALVAYAMGVRQASESLAARRPTPRRTSVTPLGAAPVPGRWVVHAAAGAAGPAARVVLYLHGGAYVMGSSRTHLGLAGALSRTARAAVAVPDYRLAPEHPFPAALDDVERVYRWLVEDRGVAPGQLALGGDSAGGGLAVGLLVRLRAAGAPLPACAVLTSPWLDLAGTGASMRTRDGIDPWLTSDMTRRAGQAYAAGRHLQDPELSPLYADLRGLPPVLVHAGGDEILLDDARRFVTACRAQGVEASFGGFDGMWHAFPLFPGTSEARDALREAGGFVRRHTVG